MYDHILYSVHSTYCKSWAGMLPIISVSRLNFFVFCISIFLIVYCTVYVGLACCPSYQFLGDILPRQIWCRRASRDLDLVKTTPNLNYKLVSTHSVFLQIDPRLDWEENPAWQAFRKLKSRFYHKIDRPSKKGANGVNRWKSQKF